MYQCHDLFGVPKLPELVTEIDPILLNRGKRILREGVVGAEEGAFRVVVDVGGGMRERDGVRTLRLRVTLFSFSS